MKPLEESILLWGMMQTNYLVQNFLLKNKGSSVVFIMAITLVEFAI